MDSAGIVRWMLCGAGIGATQEEAGRRCAARHLWCFQGVAPDSPVARRFPVAAVTSKSFRKETTRPDSLGCRMERGIFFKPTYGRVYSLSKSSKSYATSHALAVPFPSCISTPGSCVWWYLHSISASPPLFLFHVRYRRTRDSRAAWRAERAVRAVQERRCRRPETAS